MIGVVRRWTAVLVAAVGVFAAAPAAAAEPSFGVDARSAQVLANACNRAVCFDYWVHRGRYGVTPYGGNWLGPGQCFWGHFHVWGPAQDSNTEDRWWCHEQRAGTYTGPTPGTVCVEGWEFRNGQWRSIGLPCRRV